MSANNNRDGVEKALGMSEDRAIDEAWAKGRAQGLKDYRAMMKIQIEHEAANAPRTPPATPADINMLWAVIDELKARIDALEGRKAGSEDRFTMKLSVSPDEFRKAWPDRAKMIADEIDAELRKTIRVAKAICGSAYDRSGASADQRAAFVEGFYAEYMDGASAAIAALAEKPA